MKNNELKEDKKEKLPLKERLKDKREKAKIELIFYGIVFIIIIIFARVAGGPKPSYENNTSSNESFIYQLEDNYEYYIIVNINDDNYHYYGRVLGNNKTINVSYGSEEKTYSLMNNKYYVLEDSNYILTSEDTVYPYIDYHYLDINNIKEYIDLSTKEDTTYKVQISDIILNSQSNDYITVNINEGDNNIVVDYTSLFKLEDTSIDKVMVNITYSNIDNIISLEE